MLQEKRVYERVRAFLRAQIIFNNRMNTVDCIIKNYSAAGAKIALSDTLAVPAEFEVFIPAKQRTHRARLVWRDRESIGINFLEPVVKAPEAPAPAELAFEGNAARLRELEVQNAELRVKIRMLSKRLEDLGQDPNIAA
jgi:hypothetical protein